MAVLKKMFFGGLLPVLIFAGGFSARAGVSNYPLRDVVYDRSDPSLSVAVMGDEYLEMGSFYEDTQVTGFTPDAVVLHHFENDEAVKCLKQESLPPSTDQRRGAVQFFIAKQMKAIHQAQIAYWDKFGGVYAPDINTLVEQGFLKGFENQRKQGYFFEIVRLGQTKGFVMAPRESEFLAMASPENPEESDLFFSVNRLGEVRYGATRLEAEWGPVWDYSDLLTRPQQQVVREES